MKYKNLGVILVTAAMVLAGCTTPENTSTVEGSVASKSSEQKDNKYRIVTSTFYEYDWVMQVLGDKKDAFDVTLLMDSGADLHSYAPTGADIVTIGSADLFVYNGGHSHEWVADIVAEPINKELQTINIIEQLGDAVQQESALKGPNGETTCDHNSCDHDHDDAHEEDCDHEHDEDHDHDHDDAHEEDHNHDHDDAHEEDHDHDHEGHHHEDEHIWLSLRNAMTVCNIIATEIGAMDTANAEVYQANADAYIQQLTALDKAYTEAVDSATKDTIIFADRFPFLYMMSDYDIEYYAAFQGCSAESEASFETIKFLAEKVDELEAKSIVVLENGMVDLANTINESVTVDKCEILTINSMETVSQEEIEGGATYLKFMEENLEIIKKALA